MSDSFISPVLLKRSNRYMVDKNWKHSSYIPPRRIEHQNTDTAGNESR